MKIYRSAEIRFPYLFPELGSDRAVSRQEIEKLALFAGSNGKLIEEDINNSLGDSGAVVGDQITIAILNGNIKQFKQIYSRSQQIGQPPISLLRQILSLFRNMLSARLTMETGQTSTAAISSLNHLFILKLNLWSQRNFPNGHQIN